MASKVDKSAVLILLIPTVLVLVLVVGGVAFDVSSRDVVTITSALAILVVCVSALLAGFRQARRVRREPSARGQ